MRAGSIRLKAEHQPAGAAPRHLAVKTAQAQTAPMSFIELEDVTKTYGRRRQICIALDDVSFSIEQGEFVLLAGPSGAGKTTLLRMLYGAQRPSRGRVRVGGYDVGKLSRFGLSQLRRQVGVVFQDYRLIGWASALDNVKLALEVRGDAPWRLRKRACELLARFGIDPLVSRPVSTMSGGEQQRIALARALAGNPPIVLADEATGNLDYGRACEVLDGFAEIRREGTTVIFASHSALVRQRILVDRVLRLGNGSVVENRNLAQERREQQLHPQEVEVSSGFLGWESCEAHQGSLELVAPAFASTMHSELKEAA